MKPLEIVFPADGVRGLLEFAWGNLERQYGVSRGELQVWPELAFNADFESGVFLFPANEGRGGLSRVFALGGEKGRDIGWREMVAEVEKVGWTVFGIDVECMETALRLGSKEIVVLLGDEIEIGTRS